MRCPSSSVCLQTVCSFTPTVSWVTCTGPQQTDCKSRWAAADCWTPASLPLRPSDLVQGHPWERREMRNDAPLGGKKGPWRLTGPSLCRTFVGIEVSIRASLPHQAYNPFPKSRRSAVIDLASGPSPSGAKATVQFTSSFWCLPALL